MSEIGEKGVAAAHGPADLDESLLDDCDPEDAKLVSIPLFILTFLFL